MIRGRRRQQEASPRPRDFLDSGRLRLLVHHPRKGKPATPRNQRHQGVFCMSVSALLHAIGYCTAANKNIGMRVSGAPQCKLLLKTPQSMLPYGS